jgi:DNA-binding MarR family transcriptional regulator
LKSKGYADGGQAVKHSLEDDLHELVQLFAQVVASQKRGRKAHELPEFKQRFEDTNLGPRHVRVLVTLSFADALSVSELAGRIGLSLATTSLMVGELSRAGIVERSEDEADRRRTLVRLHRDIVQPMQAIARERTEPLRRALERMPQRDRETFMRGWRILAEEATHAVEAREAAAS